MSPRPAHAQDVTPAAHAKALIAEARKLLKAKQVPEACAKLDEAETLVPATTTEIAIADCREKNKQLSAAYEALVKAGAGKGRKAAYARRLAKKLEPKLKYLTIIVRPERRVFQLELRRDDTPIPAAQWGEKLPIDPGTYTLTAHAPGRIDWSTTVTIDQREQSVEMPALDQKPVAAPPPRPVRVTKHGKSARRFKVPAIALAITGLGGVGAGIAFGLRARSLSADSDAICPHDACLDPHALDLNKRARTSATLSNVGFVAGGVAIAGAVVLWWIGRPHVAPVIDEHQAGVVVGGVW